MEIEPKLHYKDRKERSVNSIFVPKMLSELYSNDEKNIFTYVYIKEYSKE